MFLVIIIADLYPAEKDWRHNVLRYTTVRDIGVVIKVGNVTDEPVTVGLSQVVVRATWK